MTTAAPQSPARGSCCDLTTTEPVTAAESPASPEGLAGDKDIVAAVKDFYSDIARMGTRADYANAVAKAFGYTEEELTAVPDESHMGLSCGNPTATASLKLVIELSSLFQISCSSSVQGRSRP